MSDRPRFTLGWYNGWSPEERRATLPIQRDAIRSGQMARPTICSVCGSSHDVWLHDERYDRPLEAYPVCRLCHRALHMRFDEPAGWMTLVAQYGGRGEWFEQLSLDPQSQWRPFDQTYSDGLATPPLHDVRLA
jgi:hypothetical protein